MTRALATATRLNDNEISVFCWSGHGGPQPDQAGPRKDEIDGKGETLMLCDGELRDDSLDDAWLTLKPGARVGMSSDDCDPGTDYKTPHDAIHDAVTSQEPGQQSACNEYGPGSPAFRQQQPFTA